MDAESWTTREETHAPGMRLSLIAHGATGPLARTHCPSDSTISLALRPSRIRSSGTFKTTAARDISGRLGRPVLVPAAHALDVRSDGEAPRRLLCCALTDDRLERDTGMLPSWTSGTLARCLDMRSTPLIGILERLARELEAPGFASDTLVDSTGSTLGGEIEMRRLALAKRLLAESGDTVADIAGRLGFRRAASFSAAFRRQTGMSPLAFRQRLAS